MSEMLTAHAAKHTFLRDTKARFSHTSNERDGVIGATAEQIQTKRTDCADDPKKNMVTSKTLTASANATAPRSSILLFPSEIILSVALAFWLLLRGTECPIRKVALPENSCMLKERVKRRALPWWRRKLGTLNAETAMSQDLWQPLSCCVIPAKMCRTAPRRFLSMS